MLTIGAGGGSLAWLDPAGSLRNGPQSAGADPGPACYGAGGDAPTNTDANLFLGRLGTSLAGGAKSLDRSLAEKSIQQIAEPLGLSLQETAGAIVKVANANMADAVRLVSIRRGLDPRDFALVAFGGAGALHGAEVARELSIPTVLVPANPGVTSALGCLLVDVRHDLSAMYSKLSTDITDDEFEHAFAGLESEALERLAHENVAAENIVLQRSVSMRYAGQWRSLTVNVAAGPSPLARAIARFHEQHEQEFAFRRDDTPVEIYQIGLEAIGRTPKPDFAFHEPVRQEPPSPDEVREVWFEATGWVATPVYDRDRLPAGTTIAGPAIVFQLDSTIVVPPSTTAEVDCYHNIRIHVKEA